MNNSNNAVDNRAQLFNNLAKYAGVALENENNGNNGGNANGGANALGNATAAPSQQPQQNANDLLQQLQQQQQMQQLMAMMANNANGAPAQRPQQQPQQPQNQNGAQNPAGMLLNLLQQQRQQRQQAAQEEQEQQQLAMTTAEQLLLSFAANAASNNNNSAQQQNSQNATVQLQQRQQQVPQNSNTVNQASQRSQQQQQQQMPDLSQLPPQMQLQILQQQMAQQNQQQRQVQGAANAFQNSGAAPQANLNDNGNNTETQLLRQQLAMLQQQLLGTQQHQQPQQPTQQPNAQAQPQNVQNGVANQLLAIQQQQRLQQQQLLNMMAQNPGNNATAGGVLPPNLQRMGARLPNGPGMNNSNEGQNQATLLGSRLPPMQQLAALQNNMGAKPNLQQQYRMLMGQQQTPQQAQAQPPANPMLDFLALMKSSATNTNNVNMPKENPAAAKPKAPKPTPSKPKRNRKKTFPEKLMQAMLDNEDDQVLAWLPDLRSFVIVDPDLFCSRVLKETFREVKYPSFVRKLHRWGFVRLTSGTGTDCFYHPLFQKGNKELAGTIQALSRTGGKLLPSNAASKPPSLAGVEKFVKSTIASSAAAASTVASPSSKTAEEKSDDD